MWLVVKYLLIEHQNISEQNMYTFGVNKTVDSFLMKETFSVPVPYGPVRIPHIRKNSY